MKSEELKSAAAELQSIAGEGALFSGFVAEGHATPTYASVHPEYLHELAASNAKTLAEANAAPGLQNDLDRLRELAQQLEELISGGSLGDRSREFKNIAAAADKIRRSL